MATRPTSDRLRETLFNILAPRIEGAAFVDLYAGSGAVGIEAMSRGVESVILVENAQTALKVLHKNLVQLDLKARTGVYAVSVGNFLRLRFEGPGFDIVFLDPPYDSGSEYESTLGLLGGAAQRLLNVGALVVAEHRRKDILQDKYGTLQRTRLLQQGDAALSFYSIAS